MTNSIGITYYKSLLLLLLVFTINACKSQVNNKESIPKLDELNKQVDGKKVGLWRVFHENKQVKSEGYYKDGEKEGLHKEWDEMGVLTLEGYYKKGLANGLMKWYHGEDHLAAEGEMENDIRQGRWKICDIENTGFCIDANFVDGKREGIWRINHHATSDKIWKEQTWKNDKIVSERCWDLEGNIIQCTLL